MVTETYTYMVDTNSIGFETSLLATGEADGRPYTLTLAGTGTF